MGPGYSIAQNSEAKMIKLPCKLYLPKKNEAMKNVH
jgi:hypothetical protein